MNIKLVVFIAFVTLVSSYDFAGHEWGCSFTRMCNASDVHRCSNRQCIDNICTLTLSPVDWVMIQPSREMKEACSWKNYGHEPTSNMTLVGINFDGATTTNELSCHTIDDCLEIMCNVSMIPDTYRIYVIADRKKCAIIDS